MRHAIHCYGLTLLLAAPLGAGAKGSWLDAEVLAQETRWEAHQNNTAPLRPVGAAALPTLTPVRNGEGARRTAKREPTRSTDASGIARIILTSARRHRLDPLLVRAVILAESAGRKKARSPKGAMGLMQLLPATARRFGVADPYDPAQNVAGGTRYLRWLLDRFGGDVTLALAGYNAGEGAVERHGGAPPYRETRNYVKIVQSNHRLLRRWAEHLAREARQ